jgi:hypothetical protein
MISLTIGCGKKEKTTPFSTAAAARIIGLIHIVAVATAYVELRSE